MKRTTNFNTIVDVKKALTKIIGRLPKGILIDDVYNTIVKPSRPLKKTKHGVMEIRPNLKSFMDNSDWKTYYDNKVK